MAGYDLSIDMDTLRTLAADLSTIVHELETADEQAGSAAETTGHDELADRLHDFSDKWRIKREDMLSDVQKLSGIMTQIVDTFTQVDADLARALEDAAEK